MGAKKSPQATLPITGQVERCGISILPGPDRTGFNENMCNRKRSNPEGRLD